MKFRLANSNGLIEKKNFPIGNVSDNLSIHLTGWIWGLSEKTCFHKSNEQI